ncbi:nucleoside diphosphate kinase [Geosporobacter subterraneus DSM 17957]|uniref:Nucleoside diphosphate kinase n=1 Tax=Geosporobacter subterraneus DSM 17957 TaxID=1121919 RepID=A0A1M6QQU9_9FIRM|nr:nucleoside-diphosphate kinase [Geosporobacter subterraneus]SHK22473.1 nucleoside diphosphate kinase [Geosporobacter subterraneus DSM 17957]
MEKTLVIIKPDGVDRKLVGEIIGRYERKGFRIIAAKMLSAERITLADHYEEHIGRPYFEELISYMVEGRLMVMAVEGENAIEIVRMMNGHKDPKQALPGTIRGDFAHSITKNIIHASDSKETAEREIRIWFPELI